MWVLDGGGGGRSRREKDSGVWRPRGGWRGRLRRFRAPRLDCFVVEEEEDPAEVFARVDLHGAAPTVGGELVKHGGDGGNSDGRESEAREQAGGERGEEQVGGVLVLLSTGRHCHERGGGGMGAEEVAAWRQCAWSPLCTIRNFPERSGKFRSTRNGSGKIRVIPNDQFSAETARFYLSISTNPKFTESFRDAPNNNRKLLMLSFGF